MAKSAAFDATAENCVKTRAAPLKYLPWYLQTQKFPKKSLFHLSMTLDITHLAPKSQELARGFGEPFVRDDFDLASPCFACVLEGFDLDIVGNSLSWTFLKIFFFEMKDRNSVDFWVIFVHHASEIVESWADLRVFLAKSRWSQLRKELLIIYTPERLT